MNRRNPGHYCVKEASDAEAQPTKKIRITSDSWTHVKRRGGGGGSEVGRSRSAPTSESGLTRPPDTPTAPRRLQRSRVATQVPPGGLAVTGPREKSGEIVSKFHSFAFPTETTIFPRPVNNKKENFTDSARNLINLKYSDLIVF